MRKRIWFACLLAMSMTFAACGSKASTEVEQEDAATVQEDTPEAEEDTTQEEEIQIRSHLRSLRRKQRKYRIRP